MRTIGPGYGGCGDPDGVLGVDLMRVLLHS